jgi:antitoxin component YwqK of YwqJK toxin-antitoxin module
MGKIDRNWKGWYENGQLRYDNNYKMNLKHGTWTRWYGNGAPETAYSYIDGQLEGEWSAWYECPAPCAAGQGQLKEQGFYKKNLKNGSWIYFHPDGNNYQQQGYIDGRPHGKWLEWFEHGSQAVIGYYKNGVKEGKWTYFEPNGEKAYGIVFKDGKKLKDISYKK